MNLSEIMTQVRGLSYSKKDSRSAYFEDSIPVLRAGNIQDARILQEDYVFVSNDLVKDKQYLKQGDILIAASSGSISIVGKAAMVQSDMNATFGAFCKVLRPNAEKVNLNYFKHFFETAYYKRTIKSLAEGANINNLKTEHFDNLEIPLPPLDQQKKIAAILDAADAYRQKTKALIKKYDELTQSLFLDMFGDPVTNPMGWELLTFKDVLEIRNGKSQKTIENENGIYPICGSGGIMSYGDDFISEANSVIIGRKGNINKPILMKERYWHVDTAFGLNPIKTVLGHDYLYWFCVRYNFEQHNKTVTIPSLTKETLLRIKIPTPPIELQNQFAGSVQAIEAQKAQAQASLAQAEDLFNSLLQRAFKGELV